MLRIITARQHRKYLDDQARIPDLEQEAADAATRARGLELDLVGALEQVERARDDADDLEQGVGQRDHVLAEVAGCLTATSDPRKAVYQAATVLLEQAGVLGINDAALLAGLRQITMPRQVHVLMSWGRPLSAHLSQDAAVQVGIEQGAPPAGQWHGPEDCTHGTVNLRVIPWAVASVPVDLFTPWTAHGTPPAAVYVVQDPADAGNLTVHTAVAAAEQHAALVGPGTVPQHIPLHSAPAADTTAA